MTNQTKQKLEIVQIYLDRQIATGTALKDSTRVSTANNVKQILLILEEELAAAETKAKEKPAQLQAMIDDLTILRQSMQDLTTKFSLVIERINRILAK